jgi:hypothetical protein
MSFTFDVRAAEWRIAMEKLRAATRQSTRDFITEQFRLLLEQIMAFTPPKSSAQGRKRVEIDISRVFRPFESKSKPEGRLAKIIRTGNYAAFDAFVRHAKLGWRAQPFSEAYHEQQRDARGRVRRSSRSKFVLGRPDTAKLRAYIRRKKDNVGIGRSGWAKALQRVGGAVPGWVSRHGTRFGEVVDGRGVVDKPQMLAINRTPWAGRKDEGVRIISDAMKSRTRRLQTALRVQLRLAAEKSGFKTT